MLDAPSDLARLLSLIAHELRTPLSVTSGYVKMLASERPGPLTDGQRHVVAGAGRACDMLSALGSDLALLGRLERGEVTPAAVAVDLPAVVGEIADAYRSHPDHPVTVRVAPSDPVTVHADVTHLRRTLHALLAAVVRAAPDQATVDIGWRSPGTSVVTGGAASAAAPGGASGSGSGPGTPGHAATRGHATDSGMPWTHGAPGGGGTTGTGTGTGTGAAAATGAASAAADPVANATERAGASDSAPGEAASVRIAFAVTAQIDALLDAAASSLAPLDETQAGLGLILPIAARLMALERGTIGSLHEMHTLGLRLTLPLRA